VSNLYIVDLENFATASRRYTGDIHNTPMVGLFMTPIVGWKRLDRVAVACTYLLHASHCPLAIAELLLSAVIVCMAVGLTGRRMWMGYFCGRLFTATGCH